MQNFKRHKKDVSVKKTNTENKDEKDLIKSKEIENSALKKILDHLNKELNT